MKTTLFGALALLLCCSAASPQPALPPVKTEAQLLFDKCRLAYGELKTFRGTVKTNSLSTSGGKPNNYGGTARVTFERPNSMRIDGKLANGGEYSILGNAGGAWYRWVLENGGKWKKVENLDIAVASMTGVAGGAPTNISSLLLPALGIDPFRSGAEAKLEGEETIDGQACYKITARPSEETVSWWIDKKTLLLRRIVNSYDEKQSATMLARTQKIINENAKQTGAPAPKIEMRFISKVEDLKVEALNAEVDGKAFDMSESIWPWPQG